MPDHDANDAAADDAATARRAKALAQRLLDGLTRDATDLRDGSRPDGAAACDSAAEAARRLLDELDPEPGSAAEPSPGPGNLDP